MNEIDDGGPAFPIIDVVASGSNDGYRGDTVPVNETRRYVFSGMTLRDWFAGQALAGVAANPQWDDAPWEKMAEHAYKYADAMLAARSQS